MGVLFSINPSDGLPIYRQIVEQVKRAIYAGKLRPGDQLATHRDLAAELVIAPMTVKKAYDVLEQEGLIVMGAGKGTFVSRASETISKPDRKKRLADKMRQLLLEALVNDVSLSEIQDMAGAEYSKIKNKQGDKNE